MSSEIIFQKLKKKEIENFNGLKQKYTETAVEITMKKFNIQGKLGILVFSKPTKKIFFPARTRTWNLLVRSQTPWPLGHEEQDFRILLFYWEWLNMLTIIHVIYIFSFIECYRFKSFSEQVEFITLDIAKENTQYLQTTF